MNKKNVIFNVIISIFTLVDVVLIYISDYKNSLVIDEIIFDIFGGIFSVIVWNYLYSKNEKIIYYLKWITFLTSVVVFLLIFICIIRKELDQISTGLSGFIPFSIAYYAVLVRKQLEDKYII